MTECTVHYFDIKTSTWKRPWSVLNTCASNSQITLNSSLMDTTSPNTPAIDGSISKFSEDSISFHRLQNWQMISSASALTNPVTLKPSQLPNSSTTNGAQLFLGSLSTTSVLNTPENATPTICYKPLRNITPSPHFGRRTNLRELNLIGHTLPNTPSASANCS